MLAAAAAGSHHAAVRPDRTGAASTCEARTAAEHALGGRTRNADENPGTDNEIYTMLQGARHRRQTTRSGTPLHRVLAKLNPPGVKFGTGVLLEIGKHTASGARGVLPACAILVRAP